MHSEARACFTQIMPVFTNLNSITLKYFTWNSTCKSGLKQLFYDLFIGWIRSHGGHFKPVTGNYSNDDKEQFRGLPINI